MGSILQMTRKDFEAIPARTGWLEETICRSVVILPDRRRHDSGFRCMSFVPIGDEGPICRVESCSDVVHVGGIADFRGVPGAWSIDCLPVSGLFRIWPTATSTMVVGRTASSMEIWAIPKIDYMGIEEG